MLSQRRRTSVLFFSLMVIQVLSPLAHASATSVDYTTETNADLEHLALLGIEATATAEHGWMEAEAGEAVAHLRFRDLTMIAPSDWTQRTGETTVDGTG